MQYSEAIVRTEALVELLKSPSKTLTTTQLIENLEKRLNPTGMDAEILENRGDTHFSQKVRNLVSHRNQGTGLEARGLAIYNADEESWTLTELGEEQAKGLPQE